MRNPFRMASLAVTTALVVGLLAAPAHSNADERFKPFKLKTLDGTQRTLSDVLAKATLVVFFFPTCSYCNAALPHVQELYDRYREQGFSVVWINVVPAEAKLIPAWRMNHRYTVPVLLGGAAIQNDYKLVMTPTHYLFDAAGRVLSRHAGYQPGDEVDLEHEVRRALSIQ